MDNDDRGKIQDANEELSKMLNGDEMREAVVLVFANTQDLPNAMTADEVTEMRGLRVSLVHTRVHFASQRIGHGHCGWSPGVCPCLAIVVALGLGCKARWHDPVVDKKMAGRSVSDFE